MKAGTTYDQYERVEELMEELDIGLEIQFAYQGHIYWISPRPDGYLIYEADNDASERTYPSRNALLDQHQIGGVALRQLVTRLEVLLH